MIDINQVNNIKMADNPPHIPATRSPHKISSISGKKQNKEGTILNMRHYAKKSVTLSILLYNPLTSTS